MQFTELKIIIFTKLFYYQPYIYWSFITELIILRIGNKNNLHCHKKKCYDNFFWSEEIRIEKPSLLKSWNPSSHFLHSVVAAWERVMLDINLFREEKGHNPELIRESQRRRFASVEAVDEVIDLDKEWRKRTLSLHSSNVTNRFSHQCYLLCALFSGQFEFENLRKEFNKINKEVSKLKRVCILFSTFL